MGCTLLWAKWILQPSLQHAGSSLVSLRLSLWLKKNHAYIQRFEQHFEALVSKAVLPLSIYGGIRARSWDLRCIAQKHTEPQCHCTEPHYWLIESHHTGSHNLFVPSASHRPENPTSNTRQKDSLFPLIQHGKMVFCLWMGKKWCSS